MWSVFGAWQPYEELLAAAPSLDAALTAGSSLFTFGEHPSDPPGDEPRDGFGNVSRNDAGNEPDAEDTGDHIADHACIADDPFGADCVRT